jgi:hypothetical protein
MATDFKFTDRKFIYPDARVRKLVVEQKPAPRGAHFLVVKTNGDGRACAWGKAAEFTDAVERADQVWSEHGYVVDGTGKRSGCCYDGETVGEYQVHLVGDRPLQEQL